MEKQPHHQDPQALVSPSSANYWQLLSAAEDALGVGDFPAAERRYDNACDLRAASPGRVFVTEKVADGLRRLFDRVVPAHGSGGRWVRAARTFVKDFSEAGELIVREGVRLSELRPEDDAETNQPILESALYLVARSRIFQDEPASAVPLLKGLFRTARRTGRPFNVILVRHDLPLTEEDRLWMASKGGDLVAAFVDQGHLRRGSPEAQEWAQVFLQLLQVRYFAGTGRLDEERAWLEAVTADRLLGRAAASVDSYRAYLAVCPAPSPRSDEARLRLLELLGNIDCVNFAVPRYQEAMGAMQSAGLAPGSAMSLRYEEAIARLEYRQPEPEADGSARIAPAWASVAVEADGRLAIVYWWDNEPRDVAFWAPGDDPTALNAFLATCEGRLLAADEMTLAAAATCWADDPAPWTAVEYVAAIMESKLPVEGLAPDVLLRLALGETGPWRAGWRPALGHVLLEPPRDSASVVAWQQGPVGAALEAGLLLLAVRSRIAAADLSLRAGLGEMARRGDPATAFLYGFLTLKSETERVLDATFEPWTLPLLWTRSDPFGWTNGVNGPAVAAGAGVENSVLPDLGRSDLAIVTTGNAPAVLASWGGNRQKWRVVLDRMDRLESLTQVASGVVGPVTLIPAGGRVHSLTGALDLLDDLLANAQSGAGGLLAIFHWTRLVETHNGDLLDFQQVRPRPVGAVPLHDRYARLVADIATEQPHLAADGSLDTATLSTWGGQFSQRVRKAGLVAGTVAHLGTDAHLIDSLWGVFEGSDAAWVFLDSAAVHWTLHQQGDFGIQELHQLLHTRGGRHLSLLSAASWQRGELEALLATWLQVYGKPYCLSLTDTHAPALRLVDQGISPGAQVLAAEGFAGQVAWIQQSFDAEGIGTVLLPRHGLAAAFWRHMRDETAGIGKGAWLYREVSDLVPLRPEGALVVPVLHCLETKGVPVARQDTQRAWAEADAERAAFFAWRRKLCSLEIAALLAGQWRSVDILDSRWWRLLYPLSMPSRVGDDIVACGRVWTGEMAALRATDNGARTFDVPEPKGPIVAQVRDWLAGQSENPVDVLRGGDTAVMGVSLVIGPLSAQWQALIAPVVEAWERGDLSRWVLLVADAVPEGAAEIVAGGQVSGCSVWGGDESVFLPGPVLWVGPEELNTPSLRAMVQACPPDSIFVDDVTDWLPSREVDGQATALALRTILDLGAKRVVLRARALTSYWTRFLLTSCAAELVGSAPEGDVLATDSSVPSAAPAAGVAVRFLDCGRVRRAAGLAVRLRNLLERMRGVLSDLSGDLPDLGGPEAGDRELLPTSWLAHLAGLTPDDIDEGVRLLRWVARLQGDSLSSAGAESGSRRGHTLLIAHRYAEIETTLNQLSDNLAVLLPLWFESTAVPGLVGQIDLEQAPVRIEANELALVDAFLGALAASEHLLVGFVYYSPRGLLNSAVRLIGWTGPLADMLPAILRALDLFRHRTRDLLDSALETGAGFRVETGLADVRSDEREFLSMGLAMGLWRWLGPPCEGAVFLADLLTLADSATVKKSALGWDLLMAQSQSRFPAGPVAMRVDAPAVSTLARLGQLRRLLAAGNEETDDLEPVISRVQGVAGKAGDPAFLVLKGMLGTGRHEAVVRGLLRTLQEADDPGELVIFCPDEGVGAMISREFIRRGYTAPFDLRLPASGGGVSAGPNVLPLYAQPTSTVVVMCEVQRFDAETRYRVAQLGRGKLLLVTADAAASIEPWEHLFLTTPRAHDIVELAGQRRLGKAIWSEVREMAPEAVRSRARPRRTHTGHLESGYGANLVQSLAHIVTAHTEGVLPDVMRVTTPLAADLDYIGSQLRDRGWLVVPEARLDALFLPGVLEILAVATDALAECGEISLVGLHCEAAAEANAGAEIGDRPVSARAAQLLMPHLLGIEAREVWREWWDKHEPDSDCTLAELVGQLVSERWADTFLRYPEARKRTEKFLAEWGAVPLRELLEMPLWETWWHMLHDDLSLKMPVDRRPIVLLSDMARSPGCWVPGAVYLCLGTEPMQRHYEFLGHVTDSALVLYQEQSPLPSDGEKP